MTTADVCAICGEQELDRRLLHECFNCYRLYHLNPYANQPGKDCGDAVIGEEFGLYYYCEQCLQEMAAMPNAPAPELGMLGVEPGGTAPAAPVTPPESPSDGPQPSSSAVPGLPPRRPRASTPRRYRRIDGS